MTVILALLISLALALALTPLVIRIAYRLGAVDCGGASSRKIHGRTIPRLGGVSIMLAFYAPLALLLFVDSSVGRLFNDDQGLVFGLLFGGFAIAGLGIYDDIVGANAKKKFAIQFAVAIALYLAGFRIELISTPFGSPIVLGPLSGPLTILWIVGVINALNLIDGLDGLAPGVALLASATMLTIAAANGQLVMMLFMACLTGSLLGFLVYNFNPARIFLGDTGSMFVGFILAVATVQTNTKSQATVALLVPMLALGLPILDTALAMGRRLVTGRKMFDADRGHLHHRLLDRGLSHRGAVIALYGFSLMLCVAALAITLRSVMVQQVAVTAAAIAASGLLVRWLHQDPPRAEQTQPLGALRRYHRALIRRADASTAEFKKAASLPELWEATASAAAPLRPASMYLFVLDLDHRPEDYTALCVWQTGATPDGTQFSAAYPIDAGESYTAVLELYWNDERTHLTDAELAHMDHIVGQMQAILQRHSRSTEWIEPACDCHPCGPLTRGQTPDDPLAKQYEHPPK